MALLLLRYAEIGLKSDSVRRLFERILINNILDYFSKQGIECLISGERGRIFLETDDASRAIECLKHTFGVASISTVSVCNSDINAMKVFVTEYFARRLFLGAKFALRVRRTGSHNFTSMEVAKELGATILAANAEKGIRVDLSHPDIEIFIEIRGPRAYFFVDKIQGPGGLPLGSQGRVLSIVENEHDILATWLMMKRGCRAIVVSNSNELIDKLRSWDPNLKAVPPKDIECLIQEFKALAVVFGYRSQDMEKIKSVKISVPAFFPLVGLDDEEVSRKLSDIVT
ncbi:MAG: THUMP domain-containing protein [Methanomassiliicoccales archaeon]